MAAPRLWGGNPSSESGDSYRSERVLWILGITWAVFAILSAPPAIAQQAVPAGDAESIDSGDLHTCAIRNNGAVKCWGDNSAGQLGLGDTNSRGDVANEMGDSLPAVNLGAGRTARAISVGGGHTCAILDNGAVKCWGLNEYGQLGLGDTAHRGDGGGEMGDSLPAVNLGAGRTARAISAGGGHTCAILDNDAVKCWGRNIYGQLGLGDTNSRGDGANEMGDALPAVNLGAGRTARAISAGAYHTCAILDNDAVKCWGLNEFGGLGLGDTAYRGDGGGEMGDALPAVNLGAGRTAQAISVGGGHTCAILDNDALKCWGYNALGQLGLGDTGWRGDGANEMGDALPAVNLGAGRTASAIDAGTNHTCAILDNGLAKCWGFNGFGQLGLGDTAHRGDGGGEMGDSLPTVALGTGRTATVLGAGNLHTCAILDNGALKCWGHNEFGQLGLGDKVYRGDGEGEMGDNLPTVDLGKGTPRLSTQATSSAPLGSSISDTATVSGGISPTGTVTFSLYGPGDANCTGLPVFTSAVRPLSNGSATSQSYAPTQLGTYRWIASYSGDADDHGVAGACNDDDESSEVVKAAPSLFTQATATGVVGSPISDTATLSNAYNPTGTVTFSLYGPGDTNCTGTPVFTSAGRPLSNGSATSQSYVPTQPGTYRWIASFSGDSANNAVAGACNDANENSLMTSPSLAVNDNVSVTESSGAKVITVRSNDSDADGPVEKVVSVSQPAHGTSAVSGSGAAVTYVPSAGYCGPDVFTYTLAGGSSATVSVSVACVPDPDTKAPQTTITRHPNAKIVTAGARVGASFRFKSSEAGSRFACSLDGAPFRACTSPKTYRLKPGRHVFRVRAKDAAGNVDKTPARFAVKVIRRR